MEKMRKKYKINREAILKRLMELDEKDGIYFEFTKQDFSSKIVQISKGFGTTVTNKQVDYTDNFNTHYVEKTKKTRPGIQQVHTSKGLEGRDM